MRSKKYTVPVGIMAFDTFTVHLIFLAPCLFLGQPGVDFPPQIDTESFYIKVLMKFKGYYLLCYHGNF